MTQLIPTRGDLPHYDLQVQLEGVTYTLEFRWNDRLGSWFMSILDEQATTLVRAGIRLVVNWPLAAYRADRVPPGALMLIDTSSRGLEVEQMGDLGDRCQLYYFSSVELGLA